MKVVFDDKAINMMKNLNSVVYKNIDIIMEFILSGAIGPIDQVSVLGKKRNHMDLVCDCDRLDMKVEYQDDLFDDCFIVDNGIDRFQYKILVNPNSRDYEVQLSSKFCRINESLSMEMVYYLYGTHINVSVRNRIFSIDIQGKNITVDPFSFEKLISSIQGNLQFDQILSVLNQMSLFEQEGVDKIIVDEYADKRLVRSQSLIQGRVFHSRVLKRKKC